MSKWFQEGQFVLFTESQCLCHHPRSASEAGAHQRAPDHWARAGFMDKSWEEAVSARWRVRGRWGETHNDRTFCSCHPALVCLNQTSTQSTHSFEGLFKRGVSQEPLDLPRLVWTCYEPVTKSWFWQGFALRHSEVKCQRVWERWPGSKQQSHNSCTSDLQVLISPQTCSLLNCIKSALTWWPLPASENVSQCFTPATAEHAYIMWGN